MTTRSFTRFFGAGAATTLFCALRKSASLVSARCDQEPAAADAASGQYSPEVYESLVIPEEGSPLAAETKKQLTINYPWRKKDVSGITMRFAPFKLTDVVEVAPDTNLFRFALQTEDDVFFLPPCSTLQARVSLSDSPESQLERFYTPTTPNGAVGHFDLIIKKCPKGRMTDALFKLKPGDSVDFRAILFKLKYKPNKWEEIGMIAGGSGVTPMLQLIRSALPLGGTDPYFKHLPANMFQPQQPLNKYTDPAAHVDKTKLSLLLCNRSEKHIILKGYFDELATMHPDRFRVKYCVDNTTSADWTGYKGYLSKQMISETMPVPVKGKSMVLLCGPDPLLHRACGTAPGSLRAMHRGLTKQGASPVHGNYTHIHGLLGEFGYDQETVYRF